MVFTQSSGVTWLFDYLIDHNWALLLIIFLANMCYIEISVQTPVLRKMPLIDKKERSHDDLLLRPKYVSIERLLGV